MCRCMNSEGVAVKSLPSRSEIDICCTGDKKVPKHGTLLPGSGKISRKLTPGLKCSRRHPKDTDQKGRENLNSKQSLTKKAGNEAVNDERQMKQNNSRSRLANLSSDAVCRSSERLSKSGGQVLQITGRFQGQECTQTGSREKKIGKQGSKEGKTAGRLRVTSYLRVSDGIAYVEDSDWEICSATSNSSGYKFYDSSSESLSDSLSLYHLPRPESGGAAVTSRTRQTTDTKNSCSRTPPSTGSNHAACEFNKPHPQVTRQNEQDPVTSLDMKGEKLSRTKEVGLETVCFGKEVAKETILLQNQGWTSQRWSEARVARGTANWQSVGESDRVKLDLDDAKVRSEELQTEGRLILTPTDAGENTSPPTAAVHTSTECRANVNISITNSPTIQDVSSVGGGRRMGRSERRRGTKDDQVVDSPSLRYPLSVNEKANLSSIGLTSTLTLVLPHLPPLASSEPATAGQRILNPVNKSAPRSVRLPADHGQELWRNDKEREADLDFKRISPPQQNRPTNCSPTTRPVSRCNTAVKAEHRSPSQRNHSHCGNGGANMPHGHVVRRTSKGLTIRITAESEDNHKMFTSSGSGNTHEVGRIALHPIFTADTDKDRRNTPSSPGDSESNVRSERRESGERRSERETRVAAAVTAGTPSACGSVRTPDVRQEMRETVTTAAVRTEECAAWPVRHQQPVNRSDNDLCARISVSTSISPVVHIPDSPLRIFDDVIRESFSQWPEIRGREERRDQAERRFHARQSGPTTQAANAVFFVINEPDSNFVISRRGTVSGVSCILIHQLQQSHERVCVPSPDPVTSDQEDDDMNEKMDGTSGVRVGRVRRIAEWMESGGAGGGSGRSGLLRTACCTNADSVCDANHSPAQLFWNQLTNHKPEQHSVANGVADHGFGSKDRRRECPALVVAAASPHETANASANHENAADSVFKQSSSDGEHCSAERVTIASSSPSHLHHHSLQFHDSAPVVAVAATPSPPSPSSSSSSLVTTHDSPDRCVSGSVSASSQADPTFSISRYADDLVSETLRALLLGRELRNWLQGVASSAFSPLDSLSLIHPHDPSHPRQQQQVIQEQPVNRQPSPASQPLHSLAHLTSSTSSDSHSRLEQYFTCTLTSPAAASAARNKHSAPSDQSSSAETSARMSGADAVQPETTNPMLTGATDIPSDDSSLGSDDGLFLPDPLLINESAAGTSEKLEYGNPFSYSLHTIPEESERSCDEDHVSEDAASQRLDFEDADTCDYYRVARRNSPVDAKESYESDVETERSTSPNSATESMDSSAEHETAVTASSSRLEKYFTFGLVDPSYSNRGPDASLTHSPRIRLEPSVHHQVGGNISDTKFADDSCATIRPNKKWTDRAVESREAIVTESHAHGGEYQRQEPAIDKVHVRPEEGCQPLLGTNVCPSPGDCDTGEAVVAPDCSLAESCVCDNQLYAFMNKVLAQVAAMKNASAESSANLLHLLSQEAVTLGPTAQAFLKALQSQLGHLISGAESDATAAPGDEAANNSDYGSECSSEERKNTGRLSASPVTQDDEDGGDGAPGPVLLTASDSSSAKSPASQNNCSQQSNSQSLPTSSAQTKRMKDEKLDCIGTNKCKVTSEIRIKDKAAADDHKALACAVSESGESDATVSASVSLPSIDSDNNNQTLECDASMEMDDLFSSIRKLGSGDHRLEEEDIESLKSWETRIALLSQNSSFKSKLAKASATPVSENQGYEKNSGKITVNGKIRDEKMDGEKDGEMLNSGIIRQSCCDPSETAPGLKKSGAKSGISVAEKSGQALPKGSGDDAPGSGNARTGAADVGNGNPSSSDLLVTAAKGVEETGFRIQKDGEWEVISGSSIACSPENGKTSPVKSSRSKGAATEKRQHNQHTNTLNVKAPAIPALNVQLQHARNLDAAARAEAAARATELQREESPSRPTRSHSKSRIHPKSSSPRPLPHHLDLESSMIQTKKRAAQFASSSMSLSSGNIPAAIAAADSCTKLSFVSTPDADATRSRPDSSKSRTRMLFATSGVFKKLSAFRGMLTQNKHHADVDYPLPALVRSGTSSSLRSTRSTTGSCIESENYQLSTDSICEPVITRVTRETLDCTAAISEKELMSMRKERSRCDPTH